MYFLSAVLQRSWRGGYLLWVWQGHKESATSLDEHNFNPHQRLISSLVLSDNVVIREPGHDEKWHALLGNLIHSLVLYHCILWVLSNNFVPPIELERAYISGAGDDAWLPAAVAVDDEVERWHCQLIECCRWFSHVGCLCAVCLSRYSYREIAVLIMHIAIDQGLTSNSAPVSYLSLCLMRISLRFAVPPFNVPSDQCVAPTLDYSAPTTAGAEGQVFSYSMSPFTSSCSGRVVGYWFCYQNTSSTTGERVNISTVLLLEDMGTDYTIVRRFTVEAIPGRDCLSGGLCCGSRNLSAENQFGVNSSYHYGVVDLPGGPNTNQIHLSVGRPGYLLNAAGLSTQSGDTLSKSGNPTLQPLKTFQFIIGELRFSFAHLLMNQMMCVHLFFRQ